MAPQLFRSPPSSPHDAQVINGIDISSMAHSDNQRYGECFLESLQNKDQLIIDDKRITGWTVHGQYLYYMVPRGKKIIVYSIAQRRVERELQHEKTISDFAFLGEAFLISVGRDFVRLWNVNDGTLMASKEYEDDGIPGSERRCIAVSLTSFLYFTEKIVRKLNISMLHSTAVNLEQVKMVKFHETFGLLQTLLSEVSCGKIAILSTCNMELKLFDVNNLKVTAQLDIAPHLTKSFELDKYLGNIDMSFPGRVLLCAGNKAYSKLKILVFDPFTLKLLKEFIAPNPIHLTLPHGIKCATGVNNRTKELIHIDANKSNIRVQHKIGYYYQILEILIGQERLIRSYGFQTEKFIEPNWHSSFGGVLAADKDGHLIIGETNNEIHYGPFEQLHQCVQSESDIVQDLSNLKQWAASDYKKLAEDKATVCVLSIGQCSFFLAALMLLFDDDLDDELRKVQPLLFGILKSRMVSGKVLCGYEKYSEEIDGILSDLKEIYPMNNVMINEFMGFVKN